MDNTAAHIFVNNAAINPIADPAIPISKNFLHFTSF